MPCILVKSPFLPASANSSAKLLLNLKGNMSADLTTVFSAYLNGFTMSSARSSKSPFVKLLTFMFAFSSNFLIVNFAFSSALTLSPGDIFRIPFCFFISFLKIKFAKNLTNQFYSLIINSFSRR